MMTGTTEDASWPMAGMDRRRYPRKYISGTGHLLVAGQPPVEVHTQDISLGGVGVIAPRSLPFEALCKVRFALPKESYGMEFVTAPVRVAHCVLCGREYGFVLGLEFYNLPEDVAAVINRYMSVKGAVLGMGN
jgi:c-di-GMP-binding flagellar brake protein YcgR